MKLVIKECAKCGAQVEVLKDCNCNNCGIKCCGEEMKEMVPNTVDCAVEKHLPNVEKMGNYVLVSVNHVMEEDHYIEWLAIASDNLSAKKFFHANEKAEAIFPYVQGATVYAYCNKHGLWSAEIK